MKDYKLTSFSKNNLQFDTTYVALMAICERLTELESKIALEVDDELRLDMLVAHRKLLDFYQSEIERIEEGPSPYSTPYDW